MRKCFECGEPTKNDYNFCKSCFSKLSDSDSIVQCPDCDQWHYGKYPCICKFPFVQCPDCGRWHYDKDSCICKISPAKQNSTYQKKARLLSEAENLFLTKLEMVIDLKIYRITPQVSLRQIVKKTESWKWANELNRVIDFGIIRKDDGALIFCIEYDDSTHDRPDRKERDEKVENILKEAGIELVRIKRDDKMSVDFLKGVLSQYL